MQRSTASSWRQAGMTRCKQPQSGKKLVQAGSLLLGWRAAWFCPCFLTLPRLAWLKPPCFGEYLGAWRWAVLCKCFSRPENSCWIISATRRDVGITSVWLWAAETLFLDYNLQRNAAGISRLGDKDLMGKVAVSMQWFTRPEYSIEYLRAWLKGFKWF